jgi:ergothioneine biosynthesis protein EgtB
MSYVIDTAATKLTAETEPDAADGLAGWYRDVRRQTEALCEGLAAEDYVVQSMPDVSPTKWHLAHTSWFFETFVLQPHAPGYRPLNAAYAYLFNSYYTQAGERHCRAQRGYLSRPTVAEVYAYRRYVDEHMLDLLRGADPGKQEVLRPLVEIGLHHEQQHQELLVTDIKHVFSVNPLRPVYRERAPEESPTPLPLEWVAFPEGLYWIGHDGDGFAYDNESPRHRVFLEAFQLASRLVTTGEYLEFMRDGGYERPELWLSAGWATAQENEWTEPFYWERQGGEWQMFTLSGMRGVDPNEPVTHLSYYEADAFARWAGARLPTEAEWEVASTSVPMEGNFVESGRFHPAPPSGSGALTQMFGDVWEWTRSQYSPYPGYEPAPGALGEYNGKFMCNQFVLRGGSCATPASHIRRSYRNFFPPEACWQLSGVRLAR